MMGCDLRKNWVNGTVNGKWGEMGGECGKMGKWVLIWLTAWNMQVSLHIAASFVVPSMCIREVTYTS